MYPNSNFFILLKNIIVCFCPLKDNIGKMKVSYAVKFTLYIKKRINYHKNGEICCYNIDKLRVKVLKYVYNQ